MGTVIQANQFTATTKVLASYADQNCTDTQYIRISIERQKDVVVPIVSTKTNIDEGVAKLWPGKEIGAYFTSAQKYRQKKAKIYSVALGKFTEVTKNRLEGD